MSVPQTLSQLAALIADTFDVNVNDIKGDTTSFDIPGWDSLSHTVLVLRVEQHFGLRISQDAEFANVGEFAKAITALLDSKSGG